MREAAAVVETVSRRRVVPAEELQKEEKSSTSDIPDLWEYMESLTPEDWSTHVLYIYRLEPRLNPAIGEPAYIDRTYDGCLEMPPNKQRVAFSIEALKEKFGGRLFKLLLKRGREIITAAKLATEAAPKYPEATNPSTAPSTLGTGTDASAAASIGAKAIDALSGQESQAISVAMNVLRSAAEVLTKPQVQPSDPVRDRVINLALERLLNPTPAPTNPLMDKLMSVAIDRLLAPPTVTNNPVLDKIMDKAVDKILNPPAGDRTNMGIELARQIPAVSTALKESIQEWRKGVESQERTAAIMRGAQPTSAPVMMTQPSPPPQASAVPSAGEAQPASDQAVQPGAIPGPPTEWVEDRIVAILKKNLPISETVDNALDFLEDAAPNVIPDLLGAGDYLIRAGVIPAPTPPGTPAEAGILYLFQTRPILQQIPVNPRLVEFIKLFVRDAQQWLTEAPPAKSEVILTPTPQPSAPAS